MTLCDVVGRLFQGVCKKGLCIMDFFAPASPFVIVVTSRNETKPISKSGHYYRANISYSVCIVGGAVSSGIEGSVVW